MTVLTIVNLILNGTRMITSLYKAVFALKKIHFIHILLAAAAVWSFPLPLKMHVPEH